MPPELAFCAAEVWELQLLHALQSSRMLVASGTCNHMQRTHAVSPMQWLVCGDTGNAPTVQLNKAAQHHSKPSQPQREAGVKQAGRQVPGPMGRIMGFMRLPCGPGGGPAGGLGGGLPGGPVSHGRSKCGQSMSDFAII